MTRKLSLLIVSLMFALLAVEAGLRLATRHPVTEQSNKQFHPKLLYTLHPSLSGVDARGFRSSSPDGENDIVAIGDSHTYGTNVSSRKSWPGRLADALGRPIYNMGIPSYNVYSYVALMEQALARNPSEIIVGLYPGNDFFLGVCRTLSLEYWKARFRRKTALTNRSCPRSAPPISSTWPSVLRRIKRTMRATAVGDLLDRMLWDPIVKDTANRWLSRSRRQNFYFEAHGRTFRIPETAFRRRLRVTSMENEGVSEHLENGKILLEEVINRARRQGVPVSFLMLPSRERVVYEWSRRRGSTIRDVVAEAGRAEEETTRRFVDLLRETSVPHVDVTPRMMDAFDRSLRSGDPLYEPDETHPDARGYLTYAEGAAELLTNRPSSP